MTDLQDQLAELFASTATDADVPRLPLEDVLERGELLQRVRRRRAAIGTAAAAAVAVVAVVLPLAAGAQHGHGDDRPAPSHRTSTSSPSPTDTPTTSTAANVIAHGSPTAYVSRGTASAFLWSDCGAHHCSAAWQVIEKGTSYEDVLPYPAENTTLTAGSDGFIVSDYTGGGFVIADDGSTQPLRLVSSGPREPEESLVPHDGGMRLVDTKLGTWSTLTDDTGAAFRTGDAAGESAVAGEHMADGAVELSWRSSADQPWQHRALLSGASDMTPGSVLTDGTRIAAVSAKVADDFDAVVGFSISTDAGAHWHDIPASSLPFYDASQLAETSDGTLFVGGGQGLFRSTDATWTHFVKVPGVTVWGLQPLDDGRMGVMLARLKPPYQVVAVDDSGVTHRCLERRVHAVRRVPERIVLGELELAGELTGVTGGGGDDVDAGALLEGCQQLLRQVEGVVGDEDDLVVARRRIVVVGAAAGDRRRGDQDGGRGDGGTDVLHRVDSLRRC